MYWPFRILSSNFFASDFDLIHNAGRLTSPYELCLDITEYRYNPLNITVYADRSDCASPPRLCVVLCSARFTAKEIFAPPRPPKITPEPRKS